MTGHRNATAGRFAWRLLPAAILGLVLLGGGAARGQDDPLERGNARLSAGDFAGAEASFRAALAVRPEDRDARIGLARALSFSGDHPAGEREYRGLLAAHPEDVDARMGLADVLAWQKRYPEAEAILASLEAERPRDPEVLVRRGKVALWSGRRDEAGAWFRKAREADPANEEARKGLAALAAAPAAQFAREAEAGASLLRIRRANPGTQAWAALRDRSRDGWEFLGRVDYLHRFGKDEGRLTGGATRKLPAGPTARLEAGLSPGADVFSRASAELEFGLPIRAGLAGYAGGKYSNYASADVWNLVAALEYYVLPTDAVLARYIFSGTAFDPGGRSSDGTWLVKATHFFTDDDRAWAYYSRGSEGYAAGTADQIGSLRSHAYGAGGRWYPQPRWGVEGNIDWQERDDGNRYVTVTGIAYYRF